MIDSSSASSKYTPFLGPGSPEQIYFEKDAAPVDLAVLRSTNT